VIDAAIIAAGYQLGTTPVDTLIAGPVPMHLQVAEAMESYDDGEPLGEMPEGFHEWDPDADRRDDWLMTDDPSLCMIAGVDPYD